METEDELSVRTAALLQEAIDLIVQTFDYPEQLSVQYSSVDGQKVTVIEIEREYGIETYKMEFQGDDPDRNPVLKRVPDEH